MIFQFTQEKKPALLRNRGISVCFTAAITSAVILGILLVLNIPSQAVVFLTIITFLFITVVLAMLFKQVNSLKKSNQSLLTQHQYLINAVNSINEGVVVTNSATQIHFMNAAAEKITGNCLKDVANRQLKEIYNAKNEKTGLPVETIVERVIKTGVPVINENNTAITSKSNEKIIITNTCKPLLNAEGSLYGTVLVFNDSTRLSLAEKKLKNKENENNSLIHYLPQAVYTCDSNGYIQCYNQAAAALWGRQPVIGKEKWCGSKAIFYSDNTCVRIQDSPMALAIKQRKAIPPAQITIEQPNGNKREVVAYPAPLFDEEGNLTGGITMLVDMTEKILHDKKAFINEDKYQALVEQASEAIFITDSLGHLLESNEQASIITGYTKNELKILNIARLFPKENFESNYPFFKKLMDGNEKIVQEFTAVHKNKSLLNVLISAKKLTDGRLMAIVKDLTELKQKERSLLESEQLNSSILTSVTSHIAVIDNTGTVVTANKAWSDFKTTYGKTVLERCNIGENFLVNTRLDAACGDITAAVLLKGIDAILSGNTSSFEYEYCCPVSNKLKWFFIRITPFTGKTSKLVLSHEEVTERKNAEKETGNYRFALDQSSIVDVSDCNGVITYVNDNFCALSGYSGAEVIGKSHKILNSSYHSAAFYKQLWDTITKGKVWTGEIRNLNKNGEPFWVNTTIVPFLNAEGNPVQFISIRSDISRRKAAEEKVHIAMERFRFLSHATSDTVWDWDIENDKIIYNEGIIKILGYNKDEVHNIQNWWKENFHPADVNYIAETIKEAFASKQKNLQLEYRFKCSGGSYKYIFDRAFILYNNEGQAYRMIGAMQDVTYKKEEEQRISKAVVDAQEAERQYLGMELHDNINQLLTGTVLMLGAACHAGMEKEEVLKIANTCKVHLSTAVEEIRNLSHRLTPAAFTTSLQHEFTLLVKKMGDSNGFKGTCRFKEIDENYLAPEIKICLYRILQEQMTNITKHANAKNVQVGLCQNKNSITLKITDDGIGFNSKNKSGGIGLNNIKKRTGYFAGSFTLKTAPGKGCFIEVVLPINPSF